jgi:hypothetical protein
VYHRLNLLVCFCLLDECCNYWVHHRPKFFVCFRYFTGSSDTCIAIK